jgi:hypothetical protein
MATLMEKSSIEARNWHLWSGAVLPAFTRRFPSSQDLSAPLQLISPETRDSLTQGGRFANQCNVYSARTVIVNFIERGGDAYGLKLEFFT